MGAASFVASGISGLGVLFDVGQSPTIAVATSVLFLIPGVPMINGIIDLMHGHIIVGQARAMLGAVISFLYCYGHYYQFVAVRNGATMSWLLLEKCLWAAVAALGFATLFTAPIRAFWAAGILAALGYLVRGLTMHYGGDLVTGTLIASCTMGLIAIQFAHWVHTPTTVFMAPAVIPMVPGVYAYRTMMGLLEMTSKENASIEVLIQTVNNGLIAIFYSVGTGGGGITAHPCCSGIAVLRRFAF